MMKNVTWVLITISLLVLCAGCSNTSAQKTNTQTLTPVTSKPGPSATPQVVTTSMARPAAGKSQEITFNLKAPDSSYSLVIFLENGETLDLDWKFVANRQVGINFMLTTPVGKELDANLKPINLAGHPFYDQKMPDQKPEPVVGSSVVIKVGSETYFNAGYYTLVFSGSPVQSGTVYLRYFLEPSATK
jgi:hypothetical protein